MVKIRKHTVKIRFEGLKCPLCKHRDDVTVIVSLQVIEDGGAELEKAANKEVRRMKQDKTTCLKCGFRIRLRKAKKTTWKKMRSYGGKKE